MSRLLKFRFRWRADGKDHETVVEAEDYPMACYKFGRETVALVMPLWRVPKDFSLNLSKPERVEE